MTQWWFCQNSNNYTFSHTTIFGPSYKDLTFDQSNPINTTDDWNKSHYYFGHYSPLDFIAWSLHNILLLNLEDLKLKVIIIRATYYILSQSTANPFCHHAALATWLQWVRFVNRFVNLKQRVLFCYLTKRSNHHYFHHLTGKVLV